MGTKKISQLTSITGVSPSDVLVIVHSGVTYQIPYSALTSTFAINLNDQSEHHSVYAGNNEYVKSELHEDLSRPYGNRSLHIGHFGENQHDPENPDKLGIYAGVTESYNLISGHGDIDNYLQFNLLNFNSGATASSDFVATSDNGTEDLNYVNLGINSSTYNGNVGGPNDAYLFSTGNNLYIGNAQSVVYKDLIFFNGGAAADDFIKMRITAFSGHTIIDDLTISGTTTVTNHLILPEVVNLNFFDDAFAEAGGVEIGGVYHTDGVLKIRIT